MTLEQFFASHPHVALAFSGGADSSYLLYAATRYAKKVAAYYVQSAFQPAFEREDARRVASQLSVPMTVLEVDILSVDDVAENPPNRCYHCKRRIFTVIAARAKEDGYTALLEGTNASDSIIDRPGMQALAELHVYSPLRLCGLQKSQIRALAKEAGLPTWNKPAYACLATRIPPGQKITAADLQRTEQAEEYLHHLGFSNFRVRTVGDYAKIEGAAAQLPLLLRNRMDIVKTFSQWYKGVWLDMRARDDS